MMYPAFTETSIKPHPNFLTERFLFNRGKRTRSYWRVHIITGGYQRRGERNQSCCHVMCAAGFAAAHDHRTFRRTSQFTNALKYVTPIINGISYSHDPHNQARMCATANMLPPSLMALPTHVTLTI